MLRFLSAGESHGQALVITLDGMPAGLDVDVDALNAQLRRRQGGYGRGRRMAIESDRAEILAGVRRGKTTGAPIAMLIRNRDWVNWQQTMHVEREMPEGASGTKRPEVTRPRPGHADLAGALKYGHEDIRDVLERASARETASRVAAGSLARQLLARFGIRIASHVSSIGDVAIPEDRMVSFDEARAIDEAVGDSVDQQHPQLTHVDDPQLAVKGLRQEQDVGRLTGRWSGLDRGKQGQSTHCGSDDRATCEQKPECAQNQQYDRDAHEQRTHGEIRDENESRHHSPEHAAHRGDAIDPSHTAPETRQLSGHQSNGEWPRHAQHHQSWREQNGRTDE